MWILPWQCCQPLKCTRVTHAWFWFGRSKKDASRLCSNRSLLAALAACLLTHTLSNKALRDARVAAGQAQWLPRLWASQGPQFAAPNLTAVCFSRWKQACQDRTKWKLLSHVQLFVTPWTVALQAPLSMEFSRQEYWSGLPFPSPRDLLGDQTWVSCIAGRSFAIWATREAPLGPGIPHLITWWEGLKMLVQQAWFSSYRIRNHIGSFNSVKLNRLD